VPQNYNFINGPTEGEEFNVFVRDDIFIGKTYIKVSGRDGEKTSSRNSLTYLCVMFSTQDACVKAAAVVTTGSRRSTALFAIGRGAEQIKAPTMPGNPVMKSDDSQCCGSSTQNSSACIALLRHQCG